MTARDNALRPILQIVHISDLHVVAGYTDVRDLKLEKMYFRLLMRKWMEKRNWFKWREGTAGHDPTAAQAFLRFLQRNGEEGSAWHSSASEGTPPGTWLIDTGDGTTFGDDKSLTKAHEFLDKWRNELQNGQMRSLYGNHDAWPGAQPIFRIAADYSNKIQEQKSRVQGKSSWSLNSWKTPLVFKSDIGPRIECYGLNTISFGLTDNTRALGRVASADLEFLTEKINASDAQHADDRNRGVYRILATHHPVVYPYGGKESWYEKIVPTNKLANSSDVVDLLRNDTANSPELQPLIHLFLSGHTHDAMPGVKLPDIVSECYQDNLAPSQLQLVSGALMLARDRGKVESGFSSLLDENLHQHFTHSSLFRANQQFQVLRFWQDPLEVRDGTYMERRVYVRVPGGDFTSLDECTSMTLMEVS